MSIVIDVGCARYGGDYSIERLIEAFHPRVLYGFDPNWNIAMVTLGEALGDTEVFVWEKAAWTHDGTVKFHKDGLAGAIKSSNKSVVVQSVDLARFIKELPDEEEIVLKIDAEGSEYELLDHLIAKGVDERLSLLWVEWHNFGVDHPEGRRKAIESKIRCPVEEWGW